MVASSIRPPRTERVGAPLARLPRLAAALVGPGREEEEAPLREDAAEDGIALDAPERAEPADRPHHPRLAARLDRQAGERVDQRPRREAVERGRAVRSPFLAQEGLEELAIAIV